MNGRIETSPEAGAQMVASSRGRWSELWMAAEPRGCDRWKTTQAAAPVVLPATAA
jgi:hypothetical protein